MGKPIANTQFYVLDRHDQPVPQGVPGQLHIGGDGVARGVARTQGIEVELIEDPAQIHHEALVPLAHEHAADFRLQLAEAGTEQRRARFDVGGSETHGRLPVLIAIR